MNTEREEGKEEVFNEKDPTSLNLFCLKPVETEELLEKLQIARKQRQEIFAVTIKLDQFSDKSLGRIRILGNYRGELVEQRVLVRSSQTCSTAYLKTRDELLLQGLSEEEVLNFFKLCLRINTDRYKYKGKEEALGLLRWSLRRDSLPRWCHGDRKRWRDALVRYSSFLFLLNEDLSPKSNCTPPELDIILGEYLSYTLDEGLPDWLEEPGLPVVDRVMAELESDTKESQLLGGQIGRIDKQLNHIQGEYETKLARSKTWIASRDFRPPFNKGTLPEFLLALGYYRESVIGFGRFKNIRPRLNVAMKDLADLGNYIENALQLLREKGVLITSPDSIALWLEYQLKQGGLITDVRQTIDERLETDLKLTLSAAKEDASGSLQELREEDKKRFKVLNYEIKPLLELLKAEEIDYLSELLKLSRGGSVEVMIREVSELIDSWLNNADPGTKAKKQTGMVLGRMSKFLCKWIKDNWQWASRQLFLELEAFSAKGTVSDIQISPEAQEEVQQLVLEEIPWQLEGWKVFYTLDRRGADGKIVPLVGGSSGELEANLAQFISVNKIPNSIKPTSIVNAIEWLVTAPPEVEHIRIREDVNGEVFRKVKRANMRIFYQMDREDKRIVFFVYQKKALSYSF